MASLRELKKRLRSVEQTGQLAGAMRTVAASKYARVNRVMGGYRDYADACGRAMAQFSAAVSAALPCGDPSAPPCYVVVAANRGLCGGYNLELLSYADRTLAALDGPCRLVTCGRRAQSHFLERGPAPWKSFSLPDVPEYGDCRELCQWLRSAYAGGEISSVTFLLQRFRNMLTQTPGALPVLAAGDAPPEGATPLLCLPDTPTVLERVAVSCVDAVICSALLEAAAGAQAASLMAMRTACDNAADSAAALTLAISQRRQSAITSSVLETASDYGWEDKGYGSR